MIDSHCHLDHEPLFKNIKEVIDRSKKIGINNNMELEEQLKDIKKTYNDIQFDTNISKNKKNIIVKKIGDYNLI